MSLDLPSFIAHDHTSYFRATSSGVIFRTSLKKDNASSVSSVVGIVVSLTWPRVTNANARQPVRSARFSNLLY